MEHIAVILDHETAGQAADAVAVTVEAAVYPMVQQVTEIAHGEGGVNPILQGRQKGTGRHLMVHNIRLILVRHVHHSTGDAAASLESPAKTRYAGDLVQLNAAAGVVKADRDAQLAALERVERNVILGHAGAMGKGYVGILYDGCRFGRRRHCIL